MVKLPQMMVGLMLLVGSALQAATPDPGGSFDKGEFRISCKGIATAKAREAMETALATWNSRFGTSLLVESCSFMGMVTNVNATVIKMIATSAVPIQPQPGSFYRREETEEIGVASLGDIL